MQISSFIMCRIKIIICSGTNEKLADAERKVNHSLNILHPKAWDEEFIGRSRVFLLGIRIFSCCQDQENDNSKAGDGFVRKCF